MHLLHNCRVTRSYTGPPWNTSTPVTNTRTEQKVVAKAVPNERTLDYRGREVVDATKSTQLEVTVLQNPTCHKQI